jgi:hypothetical protein
VAHVAGLDDAGELFPPDCSLQLQMAAGYWQRWMSRTSPLQHPTCDTQQISPASLTLAFSLEKGLKAARSFAFSLMSLGTGSGYSFEGTNRRLPLGLGQVVSAANIWEGRNSCVRG